MTSLRELRILEGPNLYFPRAAVKLTLDITALSDLDANRFAALAGAVGVHPRRPGEPGTHLRQRAALRVIERIVRTLAAGAGIRRLGVRVRPTNDPSVIVVAYPWRDRDRATALGEAVAAVLDSGDAEAIGSATNSITRTVPGPGPSTLRPRVPVIAVTGTNGKTTTSRMIAHIARTSGLLTGWSNTDGVYIDGELVEAGDYSGPSGAGRVLAHPQVELAVTETARGGILLKGIGLVHNDVSVVTNVSPDHLGLHGVDTVDQLAEVKGVVPRITRATGWAVLNADDPRVLAMQASTKATVWLFSRDPDQPALRDVLRRGGRASTVIDGWLTVLAAGADPDQLIEIAQVPMTLAGLSRFNVENVLAAASAALAIGIDRASVIEGLASFRPDVAHNPGRMNFFTLQDRTVVMDLAHNEAGLEALLEVVSGVVHGDAKLRLAMGAVGDRTEELITNIGEIAAKGADQVVIGHKARYLRGRTPEQLDLLMRAGAARVGVQDVASYPSEVAALQALFADSAPGDVLAVMCHADREGVVDWILSSGGTADTPDTLRRKVRRG